ncbi:MAG: hypothetical protein JST58_14965 [Bacteroidetes bacterium]|nr:hypothetical protein [Bacteroidota bacterium]
MKYLAILLLSVSFVQLKAQTNNSPYSIFGIGDIEDSYFNRTSGLANTGIAYRSGRYLINNNPASFSGLDNSFLVGEIGGRAKFVNYSGSTVDASNNQSFDITFTKVVLGVKPAKNWGASIGILPYSSQNYEFSSPLTATGVNGGLVANSFYKGSGGINKVYWANSYEFFKHLSIGVNASYLFGSLSQKIVLQDANHNEIVSTNNNVALSNFYLDYGIQLFGSIGKKFDYSIGATFANKSNLNADISQVVYGADSSVLNYMNNPIPIRTFTLPNSFGAGISLTYNKRYTFLSDYKYQEWASTKNGVYYNSFLGSSDFMNYHVENSNRLSAGFEFSKKKSMYNSLIELRYYQAGFYYSNSYLNVYGHQIRDIGGSIGMGVNSKRNALSYSISLQYGVRGLPSLQLVEEKYANFTIAISYRDFLLTKGRKFF